MAFCKNCGKKLEDGQTCDCTKETKKTTAKKSEGFDFAETMKGIKDDLFASIKNPIDVIEDNTDKDDAPKAYITAAIVAITFGIFFAALMKNAIGFVIELALGTMGGAGSLVNSGKIADMIKLPYVKIIFYGFIIFAITLAAYAIIMLVIPALFKNKKLPFQKAIVLTSSAYVPMIWVNLICAVFGFLGISLIFTLCVYLIGNAIVGYNFAYGYAKYTNVKDNKFGYAIVTLVVLSGVISGIATYALSNSMAKSIVKDISADSLEDLEDDLDDLDDLDF